MTQSWPEIIKRYKESVNAGARLQAMLGFVETINSSIYSDGLYAWTSMHDLCITQQPAVYPYNGPYLKISPLFNGKVIFTYVDTFVTSKQWKRTEDENRLFERLEGIIDQLHWLVKEERKWK